MTKGLTFWILTLKQDLLVSRERSRARSRPSVR